MRTAITKAPRRPAALAGERREANSGSGVRQRMHPPFKGEVERKPGPAGVDTSITMQPKAPLLLGP
jgi:hypothetical protein